MNKNIINEIKANRLYWLARYEERVYLTLHLLRKCYDEMIDGTPDKYKFYAERLDMSNSYSTNTEFILGMMYDEGNPSSIIYSLNRAMDNAILLRDDIKSETMSYIEMSIAQIKKYRDDAMRNVTNLQPLTDWALAFWGSISQRIEDPKIRALLAIGQNIERMDVYLRFDYPYNRIVELYSVITHWKEEMPEIIDFQTEHDLCNMLKQASDEKNKAEDETTFRAQLNRYMNQLVKI